MKVAVENYSKIIIIITIFGESPQISDPSSNKKIAIKNVIFLPKISASFPYVG
jgi:hypothetical protein